MSDDKKYSYIDPVCGMTVNSNERTHTYKEQEYAFCGASCQKKFIEDPFYYASGNHKKHKPKAQKGVTYTCPMHPEIQENKPGDCPKCGMPLESMGLEQDDSAEKEMKLTKRQFWLSAVLTLPVLLLSMGKLIGIPVDSMVNGTINAYIQFILTSVILLSVAKTIFVRGYYGFANKSPNMWSLIGLGIAAAFIYSVIVTFFPQVFSVTLGDGERHLYYEAAAVIITLVFLGQLMELGARRRSKGAVDALLNKMPVKALRINSDGSEYEVPIKNVHEDDLLRIREGETIPLDGIVVSGHTNVDESMLSGEPVPVEKTEGDMLIGGTLNKNGTVVMKVEKTGDDTVLSHIILLILKAQSSQTPMQKIVDKISVVFVPMVLSASVIAFVTWLILGQPFAFALVAAISVLIIACPCALGLATPMSIVASTGIGANNGVLIHSATALELFSQVKTLIIDKTGTLTTGKLSLSDTIVCDSSYSETDVLELAAKLELGSQHPLANAVLEAAENKNITVHEIQNRNSIPGKGIQASIDGKTISIGNAAFLEELHCNVSAVKDEVLKLQSQGKSVIYVGVDATLCGVLAFSDSVKESTKNAVPKIQQMGIDLVVASGDHEESVKAIASSLNISHIHARLLPENKQEIVKQYKQTNKVAMVGDGTNDAPALAEADVGIAMGTGTDVAVQSANITLPKGNMEGLVKARRLAAATVKNIKQNLFLAFVYNSVGIPIAAGILYPLTGHLLSPMFAAAAMSLSSVSVIVNSLRLQRVKL